MSPQKGVLYIVGVPIGNLEDITIRAVKILSKVDLIASEDTRKAGLLLKYHNIKTPTTSYHDHNKTRKCPQLISILKKNKSIAIISDAGTPSIADPGYYIVKEAISNSIPVQPIPGPSAGITALSISGLPSDKFVFEGFLPKKTSQRKKRLEELSLESRTIIFYESPHRLVKMLEDLQTHLGTRSLCISRELTKTFEEILYTTTQEAIINFTKNKKPKGEFTIVVKGL